MKTFRLIPAFAGAPDAVGRAMIAVGIMVTLFGGGGCTGKSDTAQARPAVSTDSLGFPAPDRPTSTIIAPRWTDEDERSPR